MRHELAPAGLLTGLFGFVRRVWQRAGAEGAARVRPPGPVAMG